MITPAKNSHINFKGMPEQKDDGLKFDEINAIFKRRDEQRRLEYEARQRELRQNQIRGKRTSQSTPAKRKTNRHGDSFELVKPAQTNRPRKKHKKKASPLAPIALAGTLILSAFGFKACTSSTPAQDLGPENPTSYVQSVPEQNYDIPTQGIEITLGESARADREEEISAAIDSIKSNPETKEAFFNMIKTIQRMEKTLGQDPIELLQDYLSEPWGQNVELELVIPQIFFESSGMHFNKDGTVNISSADCNGFMQLSEDAQHDMNLYYFKENPQDRNNPRGNLKLGISYDHYLLKYYDSDKFDTLAAYNSGIGNVDKGRDYGDEYAQDILGVYKILKDNPELTQMLFNRELDTHLDEFSE